MYISIDITYRLCSTIAGAALVVSSAEELSLLRDSKPGGAYDPRVMAVAQGTNVSPRLGKFVMGTEFLIISLIARLGAGFGLLLSLETTALMAASWSIAAAATFFLRWRHCYGGEDGADQMLTIVSVTFALCLLPKLGDGVKAAGLFFVAGQACLAYVTAGVAKLISPQWRSGLAIQGILTTRTYGLRFLASGMRNSSSLALATCWSVIAFETSFFLAPILPRMPLLILLSVAAIFHISVAFTMGLNGFFWSFVATYPAIIYFNQVVTRF